MRSLITNRWPASFFGSHTRSKRSFIWRCKCCCQAHKMHTNDNFLQTCIVLQKSAFYLKGRDHFDIRYCYLWAEGSVIFSSSDLNIIWIWALKQSWISQNEEMNFLTDVKRLISSQLLASSQNARFLYFNKNLTDLWKYVISWKEKS